NMASWRPSDSRLKLSSICLEEGSPPLGYDSPLPGDQRRPKKKACRVLSISAPPGRPMKYVDDLKKNVEGLLMTSQLACLTVLVRRRIGRIEPEIGCSGKVHQDISADEHCPSCAFIADVESEVAPP